MSVNPPDDRAPLLTDHAKIRQEGQEKEDYFKAKYRNEKYDYTKGSGPPPPMVLDFLAMIDGNKDGILTWEDLEETWDIIRIARDGKQSNSASLNYKHLPKAVVSVLKQWDKDSSGSVGISELVAAGEAQKKMAEENRLVKQLLTGAVAVICILMAATFALSFLAVQMAKDSVPNSSGIQTLPDGQALGMGKAVEVKSVVDFPELPLDKLMTLDSFNLFYDGALHHFKTSGFEQNEATEDLTIYTHSGQTVVITHAGVVSVGKQVVDLQEARRLAADSSSDGSLAADSSSNGSNRSTRKGRRTRGAASLSTTGSFTLSAGAMNDK